MLFKLLIGICFIITPFANFISQSYTFNNTITNNILFKGIPNKITFSNINNQNDFLLEINDSIKITPDRKNTFVVLPKTTSKLNYKLKKNQRVVQKGNFKAKEIPIPELFICNKSQYDITIKKDSLITAKKINIKGWEELGKFQIEQFYVTYIKNGKMATMVSNTDSFTSEMKKHFIQMPKGSRLEVTSIKILFPDNEYRILDSFYLKII